MYVNGRSRWPRGLRRVSAATRFLGLLVRIPPRAWMSVCCECCMFSGSGLCDGQVPRPEESYRHREWERERQSVCVCVCVCVLVFVSLTVIGCNNYPLYLQWVGIRGQTKKEINVWITERLTDRPNTLLNTQTRPYEDSHSKRGLYRVAYFLHLRNKQRSVVSSKL